MKKKIMNFTIGVIVFALVAIPTFVFASSYTSTLSISANSQVQGAERSYNSSNHSISIRVDQLDPETTPKLVIVLGTKKLLGGINMQSRKVVNTSLNATINQSMGSVGSGKKVYGFGTKANYYGSESDPNTAYAGLYSGQVIMSSN